jgi:hypothetical protein
LKHVHGKSGASRHIGRCIYCGAPPPGLSKEHIIPAGLDGNITLLEASCAACATITAAFERELLRGPWLGFRSWRGMRSRRPRELPAHQPIQVRRGTVWTTEMVSIEEHLTPAAMPIFAPPALLSGAPYTHGVVLTGDQVGALMPKDPTALASRLRADQLRFVQQFNPVDFARFIAKVGYGTAVFLLGVDAFAEVFILPALLGRIDEIGRYVGGSVDAPINTSGKLHEVTVGIRGDTVISFVRLFAGAAGDGPPEYVVVVGRLAGPIASG